MSVRHFLDALGTVEDSVHTLVLPQRYGRLDASAEVEDLAAPLLEELVAVQPHGPYFLAGYSFGGILAYDIARSLGLSGETVAYLGLIDAAAPTWMQCERRHEALRPRLRRHRQRSRAQRRALYHGYTARLRRQIRLWLGLPVRRLPSDFRLDGVSALRIGSRYSQPGHVQPIEVFATAESLARSPSSSLGWDDLHRGPMTVVSLDGTHSSLMRDPLVDQLATLVRTSWYDARDRLSQPPASDSASDPESVLSVSLPLGK